MNNGHYIYFNGPEKKAIEKMVGKETVRFARFVPTPVTEKIAKFFASHYRFAKVDGDPIEFAKKNGTYKTERIVIETNTSMGDTILSLPAINEFAKKYSWYKITMCGHPRNEGLVRDLPFVDEYLSTWEFHPYRQRYPFARYIKLKDFAEVSPLRDKIHRSEIYARKLGVRITKASVPRLRPNPKLAEGFGIPFREGAKFIIVQVRSVSALRSWDMGWRADRQFPKATFLIHMLANNGYNVIVTDVERLDQFRGERIFNITGRTRTPEELAAIAERCDASVTCGDSGLIHVTASVGCPSLGIYGPIASKNRLAFYSAPTIALTKPIDCSPCEEHTGGCKRPCMNFSVEEVYKKVAELVDLKKTEAKQCSVQRTRKLSSSETSISTSTETRVPRPTREPKKESRSRRSSRSSSKESRKFSSART